MPKKAWDRIKLRVLPRDPAPTDHPIEGDELHTSRGRRYLVLSYSERLIIALVLPQDEPLTEQRVWRWTWGAR